MNTQVQRDPLLLQNYQASEQFRNQMGANQDIYATNALANQRDAISGLADEAGQGAARRGFGGDTGTSQYLQQMSRMGGQRTMAGLGASLADSGRSQQLAALAGSGNAAQAGAANLLGQQNFGLAQWQAQQQAAQAQAALNIQAQNQGFGNMLDLWRLQLGALNSFYG
jgi:hypothetical protein